MADNGKTNEQGQAETDTKISMNAFDSEFLEHCPAFDDCFPSLVSLTADQTSTTDNGKKALAAVCAVGSVAFRAYDDPTEPQLRHQIEEYCIDGTKISHLITSALPKYIQYFYEVSIKTAEICLDSTDAIEHDSVLYAYSGVSMGAIKLETKNTVDSKWKQPCLLLCRTKDVLSTKEIKLYWCRYDTKTMANVMTKDDVEKQKVGEGTVDVTDSKGWKTVSDQSVQTRLKTIEATINQKSHEITVEIKRYKPFSGIPLLGVMFSDYLQKKAQSPDAAFSVPGWDWKVLGQRFLNNDPQGLFRAIFFNNEQSGTQAWLFVDPKRKLIIVSYRGSQITENEDFKATIDADRANLNSLKSTKIPDLQCDDADFDKTEFHKGYLAHYKTVQLPVLQSLYSITEWDSSWTIWNTGHSLGGALAVISAFDMSRRPKKSLTNQKGEEVKIRPKLGMINFGCLKVASVEFAKLYHSAGIASICVCHKNDVLPKNPLEYYPLNYRVEIDDSGNFSFSNEPNKLPDPDEHKGFTVDYSSLKDKTEDQIVQGLNIQKITTASIFKGIFPELDIQNAGKFNALVPGFFASVYKHSSFAYYTALTKVYDRLFPANP